MTDYNHSTNTFIPDQAVLRDKLSQTYDALRAEHDHLCKEAIDKKFKAQSAAIELLVDADIKPYVSLQTHLTPSTSDSERE